MKRTLIIIVGIIIGIMVIVVVVGGVKKDPKINTRNTNSAFDN